MFLFYLKWTSNRGFLGYWSTKNETKRLLKYNELKRALWSRANRYGPRDVLLRDKVYSKT